MNEWKNEWVTLSLHCSLHSMKQKTIGIWFGAQSFPPGFPHLFAWQTSRRRHGSLCETPWNSKYLKPCSLQTYTLYDPPTSTTTPPHSLWLVLLSLLYLPPSWECPYYLLVLFHPIPWFEAPSTCWWFAFSSACLTCPNSMQLISPTRCTVFLS